MKIYLKGGTVLEFSLDDTIFSFSKERLCLIKQGDKPYCKDSISDFVIPFSYLEKIEL